MWKGTVVNLNNNPTRTKNSPIRQAQVSVVKVSDVIPNCPISEKLKLPVAKYNKDTPNKNIPEEKAPKIKYFNPASVDKRDRVLMEAKAYRGRLNNSIVIYMVKKSYEATSQHPPKQERSIRTQYSKKATFWSRR